MLLQLGNTFIQFFLLRLSLRSTNDFFNFQMFLTFRLNWISSTLRGLRNNVQLTREGHQEQCIGQELLLFSLSVGCLRSFSTTSPVFVPKFIIALYCCYSFNSEFCWFFRCSIKLLELLFTPSLDIWAEHILSPFVIIAYPQTDDSTPPPTCSTNSFFFNS